MMDAKAKADMQMDVLEAMADVWSADVSLTDMIRNATSPMKLNRNAPDDVRQKFHERMIEQIDAIARQSFIEGAHRGVCLVNDEINGKR